MRRRLVVLLAAFVATAIAATAAQAETAARGQRPDEAAGEAHRGLRRPGAGVLERPGERTTIKNPTGFEAALSQAVAKQLGITKVEFLRAPFGGLFSPAPKKYDFAMEEVTITSQRAKVVGFSAPYFDANQGVLIARA